MAELSRCKSENQDKPTAVTWETGVAVLFGIVFIVATLALSVVYPDPTATQYATYKTVLALAAAGFGFVIPGVIQIDLPLALPKGAIRASGAVVLFVIVYFFPPQAPEPLKDGGSVSVEQTIESGGQGITHTGSGDINVGDKP